MITYSIPMGDTIRHGWSADRSPTGWPVAVYCQLDDDGVWRVDTDTKRMPAARPGTRIFSNRTDAVLEARLVFVCNGGKPHGIRRPLPICEVEK